MFSRIIHHFFDGTLAEQAQEELFGTLRNIPEAMKEYRLQEHLHEAVAADKRSILASSRADDDLAAVFAQVAPSNNGVAFVPMLPVVEAHTPELPNLGDSAVRPLQAGFAPNKQAEKRRRRLVPILNRMTAFGFTFCVIGAIAATFGVTPLSTPATLSTPAPTRNTASSSANAAHQANTESVSAQQAQSAGHSIATAIRAIGTKHDVSLLAGTSLPVLMLSDSDRTKSNKTERSEFAMTEAYVPGNAGALSLRACQLKQKKYYFTELSDALIEPATPLAVTTLPRPKAVQPIREQFKPYWVLTARASMNLFPNGFGTSIGALYAISERDAVGVEVGGVMGRVSAAEHPQDLKPAGYVANIYRFTLPVEGTKLGLFSHIRAGIETTGTLFGGIGMGAQYQISDKVIVFATAEAARAFWKSPQAEQPLRLAHDGLSLGVALKL